jgi:hypothetical protein
METQQRRPLIDSAGRHHIPLEKRGGILALHQAGFNWNDISGRLEVHPDTARSICRRAKVSSYVVRIVPSAELYNQDRTPEEGGPIAQFEHLADLPRRRQSDVNVEDAKGDLKPERTSSLEEHGSHKSSYIFSPRGEEAQVSHRPHVGHCLEDKLGHVRLED